MGKISEKAIREITPLSDKDFFYIADRSKNEFTYPIHSHAEFELNFTERATGARRIVGDSVMVIGDYDLVLIASKDLEHVWEQHDCHSEWVREITVQFSHDLFDNNFITKAQFDPIRRLLNRARRGISFPMSAILKVYPMIDSLSTERDGFYSVLNFFTILHELALCKDYTILSSSEFAKVETHSDSARVQLAQTYINDNYKNDIRLPILADIAGMSAVAFSRFFKLRTGKSLSEYVIDIRLGYASRFLTDSNKSIAEICFDCGFNNISNFNRIFRKKKLCSPKEFRESFRNRNKIV